MKYFFSVGEISGDFHASLLAEKLIDSDKEAELYGIGGKHMKSSGVTLIEDIAGTEVMGVSEVVKKLGHFKKRKKQCLEFLRKEKVDVLVAVDFGGFNLSLIKSVKKHLPDIKVVYYIPPKLWVWGKNRIKTLKCADFIMVIFPWEVEFYKKQGIEAVYFGNPLYEKCRYIEKQGNKIILLPGSRQHEIKMLMPVFEEVINSMPEYEFVIRPAAKEHEKKIIEYIREHDNVSISYKGIDELVQASIAAVAASGTVTLELALYGIPTVVVYKFSFLTEIIAKALIKVKYISLPNLIANEEVFPELLQEQCNGQMTVKKIRELIGNNREIREKIREISKIIGGEDILKKYADFIVAKIKK